MTVTDAVARHQLVTPEMRSQYDREGYFVLERVLTTEQLELLRSGGSTPSKARRRDGRGRVASTGSTSTRGGSATSAT